MNREFLEGLGIEKEQIDTIMKEHGKAVQSVKAEDAERETTIETLKSQLEERNNDLTELQSTIENEGDLKEQLKSMNEKYEEETANLQSKLANQRKQAEIRLGITKAGAKNERAVMALLNAEEIKVDDDGVHGLKEQVEQLQESDPYLFQSENEPSGQSTPGGNTGGNRGRGKAKSAFALAAEKYTKK